MPDEVQVELQLAFFVLNFLLYKWEVGGSQRGGGHWPSSFSPDAQQFCSPTGANIVLGLEDAASGLPTSLLTLLRCIAD